MTGRDAIPRIVALSFTVLSLGVLLPAEVAAVDRPGAGAPQVRGRRPVNAARAPGSGLQDPGIVRARTGQGEATEAPPVDVRLKPMEWITPGTVIGGGPPRGWSNLILFVKPRIGVGDVEAVPRTAAAYSRMFFFTVLANVRAERVAGQAKYVLDRLAIGTALEIQKRNVISTSEQTNGAELGMLGRRIFYENEKVLRSDVRQIARTPTMLVFDANAVVLRNQRHQQMILRHVVLVSPRTGQLSTYVWLMGSNGKGGYALADKDLQLLPPAMHEDRVLSVDGDKFTLGIPSPDAFALARIPQGTALGFSEAMKAVAATRQFTSETALALETELQARYAPVAARAAATPASKTR